MVRALAVLAVLAIAIALSESAPISASPIQVYGVWHCGNDLCAWGTVRDMAEFDRKNRWFIASIDEPAVLAVELGHIADRTPLP